MNPVQQPRSSTVFHCLLIKSDYPNMTLPLQNL